MCKYFAYDYPCKWMKRNNNCRSQHDDDVKRAFKVFQEKESIGEGMTEDELRKIMDPDQKMKEMDWKVRRYLYMRYPRPLTKKEKDEA